MNSMCKKKKILLITNSFNKCGGISRYVAELAERFVKEYETHLLTTYYDYKITNLIVHKKPVIKEPLWLQILSNAIINAKYAKKFKDFYKIDIVHSNGAESLFCDVLTMHSCHAAWVDYYRRWSLAKNIRALLNPVNRVVTTIERKVVKTAKTIISVSRGVKEEILRYYKVPENKIVIIPNGVDLGEFKPDKRKKKKIRETYGIEDSEIVLMFSGHEFERKGLRFIIEALPMVRDSIKLLVIGRDNPKQYIELAQRVGVLDKIVFIGFVPDITEYYAAADIFVFPTAYEAFSLATLEAAASGLPILATKVNGTEELIKEGYNGFFIRRDACDIADKINLLTNDDSLRGHMARNARKTAEKYSWDKIAKRYVEVYEEVKY